jgi:hypothetical protein
MIVGARLGDPGLAVEHRIRLRVVAVLHGHDDPGIATQVLRLVSTFRSVERDLVSTATPEPKVPP